MVDRRPPVTRRSSPVTDRCQTHDMERSAGGKRTWLRSLVLAGVSVLLTVACGSGSTTSSGAPATSPGTTVAGTSTSTTSAAPASTATTTTGATPSWSTTPVSVAGAGDTALLGAVRAAGQAGFDRITFEFANRLPGYTVGYTERPIAQDGSGEPVDVNGAAVLKVAMAPASGADLSAGGTETYTGPKRISPPTPMVAEVVEAGDFEGHLTWVIGVRAEAGFHVSTLDSPPRLVVDVATT